MNWARCKTRISRNIFPSFGRGKTNLLHLTLFLVFKELDFRAAWAAKYICWITSPAGFRFSQELMAKS
jgi:hypothetical protein